MRSIWLASTALLMTTGIAFAQSSVSTTSPAPTGAIASPQGAPSNASAGNMAPGNAASGTGSMSSSGSDVKSSAPDGATNAPDVTAAAPGASSGKMAPNAEPSTAKLAGTSDSQVGTGKPAHPWHHNWASKSMSLPQDASATTYLHIAKSAISHHNTALADDALSHAETRLLNRSVPQGGVAADSSPSIQSIESARQALHSGNYMKASADVKQAASSASGG